MRALLDTMRTHLRTLLLAALAAGASPAMAQPAAGQVIDKVQVRQQNGCYLIAVRFASPMQYLSHFPPESGDDLRIRIEPVLPVIGDEQALQGRASIHPRGADGLPLDDVLYEGDQPGGPFLTLQFSHAVTFLVRQGDDFRSILIQVRPPDADPSLACPPIHSSRK